MIMIDILIFSIIYCLLCVVLAIALYDIDDIVNDIEDELTKNKGNESRN